jgi:GNAT superfamily N-acetyltransferase
MRIFAPVPENDFHLRRATPSDTRAAFDVSMAAMKDLFLRQGHPWELDAASFWAALQPYLTHLAAHAAEWWIAEDRADGAMLGYARSIERGGLFELSELFVHPDRQAAGVGRQLIERAFPAGRGEVRAIIATTDVRGLHRYYAAGTIIRFAMASLAASPKPARHTGDLDVTPAHAADVGEVAALEEAVFGHARHADYPWLFEHREAYLYRRAGCAVGFAFFSEAGQGPIAALDPGDMRAILLHLEGCAHTAGMASVSFQVPSVNAVAMNHLLGRGYKIDGPLNMMMSNVPFGQFDRLIAFAPAIVL